MAASKTPPAEQELHNIVGEIIDVHPKSNETWSRFLVLNGNKKTWVTAKYAVTLGQIVDLKCTFNEKFRSYDAVRNSGENGVVSNAVVSSYIAKTLPGVGAVKTSYLAKAVGPDKLYEAIVNSPEWVVQAVGAKLEDVLVLVEALKQHKAEFADISSLTNYGYSPAIAKAIVVLGLVEAALQSPYGIIPRVSGFGWKLADEVGRKRGVPLDHPERLEAGIKHYYNEEVRGNGCTVVQQGDLCGAGGAGKYLGVNSNLIRQYADKALIPYGDVWYTSVQDQANESTIMDFFGI